MYFGAHVGGATGTTVFSNPDGQSLFGDSVTTPGFLAGLQLGYNLQFAPQWVAGLELSGSVLSSQGANTCFQSSITLVGANCQAFPREIATLTGRLGFVPVPGGRTMIYGKGGVAWMRSDFSAATNYVDLSGFPLTGDAIGDNSPVRQSSSAWGWTIGGGLEHALDDRWSVNVGYDYLRFNGIRMGTPETIDVTSAGTVTYVPPGAISNIAQDLHVVRVGLNYRWGIGARPSSDSGEQAAPASNPGWQFETGARYWYSWGNFQSATVVASPSLVSRLPYNDLEGHSGELFARLDAPFGIFVKALAGGGGITRGVGYDEDWALDSRMFVEPTGYEITRSDVNGSFSYLTADIGYNVLQGPGHKVGLFVGYNRYQYVLNTYGCAQMVAPGSGICFPYISPDNNSITEVDTWHSLRVGTSAEIQVFDRARVGVDVAYLPYVYVDAMDVHRLRNISFPIQGTGNGVQAEIMLSYRATDSFDVGVGGRYWAMWTTNAYQVDSPGSVLALNTDRYGVFVQASYRFNSAARR